MDKRYQVFVSSPYDGLREERSKVMHKLLEMNCIPSGMELFPAADDDAWSLIKDVIDECDYYILILAGRYGSVGDDGMGFTEKEYRYAVEKGKPVAAFLHSNPSQIPSGDSEQSDKGRKKLEAFRELAKKKHCKFWSNGDELASVVTTSIVHIMNRKPGVGWIRADRLPADDILTETIRLQKRVGELELQLKAYEDGPPPGTQDFAQGTDRVKLTFLIAWKFEGRRFVPHEPISFETDWDSILNAIARILISSPSENSIQSTVSSTLAVQYEQTMDNGQKLASFILTDDSLETLRIQFRALGIVTQQNDVEIANTSSSGQRQILRWILTPYGEQLVAQRLALSRT
jgi:hypothetical protein